jgi:Zn finger protein HypA/HybF involved in hydrogenase expression
MSESNGTTATSQVQQVVGVWQKSWNDHVSRVTSIYEEVGKVEAKQVEQVTTAVDEMAKLTRETMSYGAQLAAEWRRLSFEAARKSTEMFTSPLGTDGFRSK